MIRFRLDYMRNVRLDNRCFSSNSYKLLFEMMSAQTFEKVAGPDRRSSIETETKKLNKKITSRVRPPLYKSCVLVDMESFRNFMHSWYKSVRILSVTECAEVCENTIGNDQLLLSGCSVTQRADHMHVIRLSDVHWFKVTLNVPNANCVTTLQLQRQRNQCKGQRHGNC